MGKSVAVYGSDLNFGSLRVARCAASCSPGTKAEGQIRKSVSILVLDTAVHSGARTAQAFPKTVRKERLMP